MQIKLTLRVAYFIRFKLSRPSVGSSPDDPSIRRGSATDSAREIRHLGSLRPFTIILSSRIPRFGISRYLSGLRMIFVNNRNVFRKLCCNSLGQGDSFEITYLSLCSPVILSLYFSPKNHFLTSQVSSFNAPLRALANLLHHSPSS